MFSRESEQSTNNTLSPPLQTQNNFSARGWVQEYLPQCTKAHEPTVVGRQRESGEGRTEEDGTKDDRGQLNISCPVATKAQNSLFPASSFLGWKVHSNPPHHPRRSMVLTLPSFLLSPLGTP